eukprot:4107818-Prymnesium_polylepis.1
MDERLAHAGVGARTPVRLLRLRLQEACTALRLLLQGGRAELHRPPLERDYEVIAAGLEAVEKQLQLLRSAEDGLTGATEAMVLPRRLGHAMREAVAEAQAAVAAIGIAIADAQQRTLEHLGADIELLLRADREVGGMLGAWCLVIAPKGSLRAVLDFCQGALAAQDSAEVQLALQALDELAERAGRALQGHPHESVQVVSTGLQASLAMLRRTLVQFDEHATRTAQLRPGQAVQAAEDALRGAERLNASLGEAASVLAETQLLQRSMRALDDAVDALDANAIQVALEDLRERGRALKSQMEVLSSTEVDRYSELLDALSKTVTNLEVTHRAEPMKHALGAWS